MHQAHELRHGLDAEEGPSAKAIAHPSSRAVRLGHHLGNRELPRSTDQGMSGRS
ncbi:hypothetical protein ACFWBX_10340 [Streptomyces sp. NPDC059991]|uniref:hypothetical protein n=1 Tax=Streptomyces sp. NPDC059991 TaxID=3347028 RepID=UPI0036C87703